MEQNRPELSLKPAGSTGPDGNATLDVVRHAIRHHLCLRASYNKGLIIIAPHILYERRGEAHIDALVLERDGAKPAEAKLAMFKLTGLRNAAIMSEPIQLYKGFDPRDARYAEQILAVIDSGSHSPST